jgi:hypothetical protein
MNTARIVVQTVAIGASGIAAYLASGSDRSAPPPAAPVAQLPAPALEPTAPLTGARQSGTLALRSIAGVEMSDNAPDEPMQKRAGVSIIRYGIPSQTARIR